MLRKVAGAAAAKPHVEIRQDGEQFYIKTSTTVRTTEISFRIGEEFDEETLDGRKCKVSHRELSPLTTTWAPEHNYRTEPQIKIKSTDAAQNLHSKTNIKEQLIWIWMNMS